MVPSSLLILASSVCKSLQYLIFALTQGGESGRLFRFTCSVVLLGGRDTANKCHGHVWGVLTVYEPQWFATAQSGMCYSDLHCSGSRVICNGTVPGGCALVPFPDLSSSGSRVLVKGSDLAGLCVPCPFQVQAAQAAWREHCLRWAVHFNHRPDPLCRFPGCATRALSQVCRVSPLRSWSQAETLLPNVNCPGSQEDVLATGSLLTIWWKMPSLGLRLQ